MRSYVNRFNLVEWTCLSVPSLRKPDQTREFVRCLCPRVWQKMLEVTDAEDDKFKMESPKFYAL